MSGTQYTESGITVDLSGKEHHRFEDLNTYLSLKGQCVKEMDYCWLEPESTHPTTGQQIPVRLFCLELKGYQDTDIGSNVIDKLLNNLEQKAKDTLLMFCAAWLQKGKGAELALELPEGYRAYRPELKIKLVMLVDEDNRQAAALSALRQKLLNRLKGISNLLDFSLTLVNLSTAQSAGLPVSAAASTT